MWDNIRQYILDPKFKEVCCNIAKRSGLSDDLYQEVVLSMLEKVHNHRAPIMKAWENNYLDWYIVSAAHTIFHSKNGSTFSKLRDFHCELVNNEGRAYNTENSTETFEYGQSGKYSSNSTGDTQASYQQSDDEKDFEEMVTLCESELGKQYWYNAKLFSQYVFKKQSIREIETRTMIPRNSIHRTLKETRKTISKKILKKNPATIQQFKQSQSLREFAKVTGIPRSTLYDMIKKANKLKSAV